MVENERSIFKNTIYLAVGRGAGDFFMLLTLIALARVYGTDVVGEYSLAMALGLFLRILITQGVNTLVVRDISRRPDEAPQLVGALLVAQMLIAAILFGIFFSIYVLVVGDPSLHRITILVVIYNLIYALSQIYAAYFRAREASQYGALLESGHKALILIVALIGIGLTLPAQWTLLALPIGGLAMYVAGYYFMKAFDAAPRLHADLALTIRYFTESLPLFISVILSVIQPRVGIFLLGATHGNADVAIFATADKIVTAADLIVMMLVGAILPVMSRIAGSKSEVGKLFVRALRLIATFSLPVGVILFLLRNEIIVVLFGTDFSDGGHVLGILGICMVFGGVNALSLITFIARDKLKDMLYCQLAVISVFLVCAALFVATYGYIGLAWSVFAAKLFGTIIYTSYHYRTGLSIRFWSSVRAPLAASAGMLATAAVLTVQPLALQVGAAIAVGSVLMMLLKGVSMNDLDYLNRVFGARRQ